MPFEIIRVGFGLVPGDPFWVQVREAIEQRAETLGITLIPITVPTTIPSSDLYLRFLEDLKAQEIGALISHVVPDSLMTAILDSGLPIICSEDTPLRHPRLAGVRGLDRAAVMAADYVTQRLEGKGNVLMIGALDDQALTAELRVHGFCDRVAQHTGLRVLRVGDGWRYELAHQQLLDDADDWLAQIDGKVDAIFGLSDSLALAGRDACRTLGVLDAKTVIVGINGDPLAIAAIEAGTMDATVETSPQDLGFKLAEYAHRAACGKSNPPHFPYKLQLVTAHNVSQVAAQKLVFIADLPSRLVDVNRRLEQQRLVQLEASLELNQRVGSILDQDELLTTMADIIRARYDYDRVHFYMWSHSNRILTLMAGTSEEGVDASISLAASGPLGHALLNDQVIHIPDTSNSQRYLPDERWPDVRSRVTLPVRVGGRPLGVLDLHSKTRVLRNQAELDALQTLADEFGVAMRNAQLYAQALQARAEAVQAGLLRSRLLANISHQLRSPLNVILGYCQAALSKPNPYNVSLPTELLQDLTYIERSGADLERLINDLLDLAMAETGSLQLYPESIDLRALLVGVFDAAVRIFDENPNVRWKMRVPAQLPVVDADPVRLRNVLLNLLNNAARFTTRGQIVLGAECLDANVHLWVQDTGCGIEPETLSWIRQQRVANGVTHLRHSPTEGAGLGLTIAQHLVQLHNGELTIESEPDQGTTCHILLPLGKSTRIAAPENNNRRASNHHLRTSQQFAEKIRSYVAANYATLLTREQIAADMGVTPAYVSRIFRQQSGITLWEYVNAYRIARARELLEHSDLTVTEIAFTVGFNDPAYFSRIFRKETGKSPVAYRAST